MRAVVLSVLGCIGCWSPPAPIAPAAPSPRREVPAHATARNAYADVVGEWHGLGTQYDDNIQWEMEVSLSADRAVGEPIGTVRYPSLECSGVLTRLPELDDGTLVLRETITHDPRSECIDGGTMRIPPRPENDTLAWRWYLPTTGKEHAAATLERAR